MNFAAVIAAAGGTGGTTVAAHLSVALARKQRLGAAIDLCPDNALRLQLGMELRDPGGFATQVNAGLPWSDGTYLSSGGVPFLPFGKVDDETGVAHFSAWLAKEPGGLGGCLERIPVRADGVLLADVPRTSWPLARQALTAARLVIVVAAPDAASYAALPGLLKGIATAGASETWVLVNGFDPARNLDQDMALLLAEDPHFRLVPVKIHRDESVREALACKQTVFDYAPSSRAAYDFDALATWVQARLGQLREKTG